MLLAPPVIKHIAGLLNLADEVGNVSKTKLTAG